MICEDIKDYRLTVRLQPHASQLPKDFAADEHRANPCQCTVLGDLSGIRRIRPGWALDVGHAASSTLS